MKKSTLAIILGAVLLLALVGLLLFRPAKPAEDLESVYSKIQRDLPYTTAGYSIDFNDTTVTFTVEILAEPVEKNKQAALNYLMSRGLKEGEFKVRYYVIPEVSGKSGP